MPFIEFLEDYKCCHRKGDVFEASPAFAHVVIEAGIAKAVDKPRRHKMVESPAKKKSHNIPGYTG